MTALTEQEVDYLLALCRLSRERWQRRADSAASHAAIRRRDELAESVARIDTVIGKMLATKASLVEASLTADGPA